MILTVTINPCIDKSSVVNQLIPEHKLRCQEIIYEPGGGGINVSKALQKLAISSTALFTAGGHNGNMLCELLQQASIPFHAISTNVETRENWVMVEEKTNQQYRFTFPGSAMNPQSLLSVVNQVKSFSPEFVVASGSIPLGVADSFYADLVTISKSVGAKCIIDTSGKSLAALRNKGAFLIKPNVKELCALLNVEEIKPAEIDDAALQLIADGYAEIIVVSMGAEGACLVSKDEKYFVSPPPVIKRSTVGAGDSMVAGMAYMLHQKKSLKEVLAFGVACGTAATMNPGTQLFKKEDAIQLFNTLMSA